MTERRKKTLGETRLSRRASSPLARWTSSLFQLQQSQIVRAPRCVSPGHIYDTSSFTATNCWWSDKYDLNHTNARPLMPTMFSSLFKRMLWSIVSNTALRSRSTNRAIPESQNALWALKTIHRSLQINKINIIIHIYLILKALVGEQIQYTWTAQVTKHAFDFNTFCN